MICKASDLIVKCDVPYKFFDRASGVKNQIKPFEASNDVLQSLVWCEHFAGFILFNYHLIGLKQKNLTFLMKVDK
jgi:hypothetical protein